MGGTCSRARARSRERRAEWAVPQVSAAAETGASADAPGTYSLEPDTPLRRNWCAW